MPTRGWETHTCGAAPTPLGAPYWPHAKAVRRCLWRKHRAVLGQCQVLISPPPGTLPLPSLSAHLQGRALSTPLPTQHCTNMSAAPCSEVGPEMWGGDGMCSNGSNHTWVLFIGIHAAVPGPSKLLDWAAQGRRGRALDMGRWQRLQQLVSVCVRLSGWDLLWGLFGMGWDWVSHSPPSCAQV